MLRQVARWTLLAGLVLGGLAIVFLAGRGSRLPTVSEEQVRSAIAATVQREARQSFLVTGRLDVVATTSIENNRIFLPSLLRLNTGTARSTVRAPGRVYYGFDVRELTPDMIRMVDDSTIHVQLPPLRILAVEPQLERMEIDTDVSWTRSDETGRQVERRAIGHIQAALRAQGSAHLRDSSQPRVNTAEAVRVMLGLVDRAEAMFNHALQLDPESREAVSALVEPELRGHAYGFHRAADHAGAVVGPLVAWVLLSQMGVGVRTIFWLAAIPAVIAVVTLVVVAAPRGSRMRGERARPVRRPGGALRS